MKRPRQARARTPFGATARGRRARRRRRAATAATRTARSARRGMTVGSASGAKSVVDPPAVSAVRSAVPATSSPTSVSSSPTSADETAIASRSEIGNGQDAPSRRRPPSRRRAAAAASRRSRLPTPLFQRPLASQSRAPPSIAANIAPIAPAPRPATRSILMPASCSARSTPAW